MNSKFQTIDEEKVLFFDTETVRRNKELITDSQEYVLYQKKTRNRETDEFLPDQELKKHYEERAALKMGYNKIVTIGVGYIKDGQAFIKDISGEEKDVVEEFCKIASSSNFKYVAGNNILLFDLPLILNNGWRYFNMVEKLPDSFITSGKKIWNLDNVLDLQEIFKGTHYYPNSLEELCYHFGLPTPKDDISGAEVSKTFYEGDKNKIYEYVKKDVFASMNIFRKMRAQEPFEAFTDKSELPAEQLTVLEKFYNANALTKEVQEELKQQFAGKKMTKKDRENLFTILRGVYVRTDFEHNDQDTKAVIKRKEKEIEQFLNNLK